MRPCPRAFSHPWRATTPLNTRCPSFPVPLSRCCRPRLSCRGAALTEGPRSPRPGLDLSRGACRSCRGRSPSRGALRACRGLGRGFAYARAPEKATAKEGVAGPGAGGPEGRAGLRSFHWSRLARAKAARRLAVGVKGVMLMVCDHGLLLRRPWRHDAHQRVLGLRPLRPADQMSDRREYLSASDLDKS